MAERIIALGWWNNAHWLCRILEKASAKEPLHLRERAYLSAKGTRLTAIIAAGLGGIPERGVPSEVSAECAAIACRSQELLFSEDPFAVLKGYDAVVEALAQGRVPPPDEFARTQGVYCTLKEALEQRYAT